MANLKKNEIQREYSRRTNYAAQKKYDEANTAAFALKLNRKTDADIIEAIGNPPSKSGRIKELIRIGLKQSNKKL